MNSSKPSIWPEGYGAGLGVGRQSLYCQRCGALVMNARVHTAWHDRVEPAEESSSTLKKVDLVPGRSVLVKSADEPTESVGRVRSIDWYRFMTAEFATANFGFPDGHARQFGEMHQAPDNSSWIWLGENWEVAQYAPVDEEGKES